MDGSKRFERKEEVDEEEEALFLPSSCATAVGGDMGPEEKLISSSPSNVAMAASSCYDPQMDWMTPSFPSPMESNVTSISLTLASSVTRPSSEINLIPTPCNFFASLGDDDRATLSRSGGRAATSFSALTSPDGASEVHLFPADRSCYWVTKGDESLLPSHAPPATFNDGDHATLHFSRRPSSQPPSFAV